MRGLATLARAASGIKHVYVIVFTGMLLYELVRYRIGRKRHAEDTDYRPGGRRH